MSTALVTDSTATVPAETARRHGVQVVPLHVLVGGEEMTEGESIDGQTLAGRMRKKERASTSRPSPAAFLAAYEAAAAAGATEIVSVHLSADISGTVESAMLATRHAPVPVTVVDTRVAGMATGLAVEAALALAATGAQAAEVAARARSVAMDSQTFFYVDSLEWLRRGGRIGGAAAFLGTALLVKPLLHLDDGHIEPLEKVRTASRALARLEELVVAEVSQAEGAVAVAVQHFDAGARAEALRDRLEERCPQVEQIRMVPVSAVLGAHAGPGLLGVAVAPR